MALIELIDNYGKSHFISEEDAERELGIVRGDRKDVSIDQLVDYDGDEKRPYFFIRPHQTLVVKAESGKLDFPGASSSGVDAWLHLKGEACNQGLEMHFRPEPFFGVGVGQQGKGCASLQHTTSDGKTRKLCFHYLITKP